MVIISAGCSLCYRRLRKECNCAAEVDRPPSGIKEQVAILSADGSAMVPAWFCAPAGQCDVPAGAQRVWQPRKKNVLPWPSSRPGCLFELQHWCMMSIIIILRCNLAFTMVYKLFIFLNCTVLYYFQKSSVC